MTFSFTDIGDSSLLTDAASLVEWMAPVARSDPRAGGELTWTHQSGDSVVGQFIALVPGRRVVFSFGWYRPDVEVPQAPRWSKSI